MTIYCYARVSSRTQNEERQVQAFQSKYSVPVENIIVEKASGKNFIDRTKYIELRNTLKMGDLLVIASLDRLGRDYIEVKDEWRYLTSHGIDIDVLDMPILNTRNSKELDLTGNFINNLIIEVLTYVGNAEREKIKDRQKEGIELWKKSAEKVEDRKTKTGNKYGRPKKTELDRKFVKYVKEGRKPVEVQALCKITKPTYYAWLKLYKELNL